MPQHDRHREDGSRCHSKVEATTSTLQSQHQANEACVSTIRIRGKPGQSFPSVAVLSMQRCTVRDFFSCRTFCRVIRVCYNIKLTVPPQNITGHLQPLDAVNFRWMVYWSPNFHVSKLAQHYSAIKSAVSVESWSMDSGCKPHHNRPNVGYYGWASLYWA